MNSLRKTSMLGMGVLAMLAFQAFSPAQAPAPAAQAPAATAPKETAPRSIAPYFTPATAAPKAPDADGFLQRWLLLEPIDKPNRSNNLFTGT
jgi:hypothetical protein